APTATLVALSCLVAFAVYAWPIAHNLLRHRAVCIPLTSYDTIPTSLLAASLERDGDFHLDEFLAPLLERYGDNVYFVTRGAGEHVVSTYPVVTALLATPVFFVANRFGWLDSLDNIYVIARVAAAWLGARAVGLLVPLFLTCTTRPRALCLTGALAFGTALWTT